VNQWPRHSAEDDVEHPPPGHCEQGDVAGGGGGGGRRLHFPNRYYFLIQPHRLLILVTTTLPTTPRQGLGNLVSDGDVGRAQVDFRTCMGSLVVV